MIQLYCYSTVASNSTIFTWTINERPAVLDVPHLRERRMNNSANTATSVLTVDNFQSGDSGTYQCFVEHNNRTFNGTPTTLTGIELYIISE